jgi:hypothetical protein
MTAKGVRKMCPSDAAGEATAAPPGSARPPEAPAPPPAPGSHDSAGSDFVFRSPGDFDANFALAAAPGYAPSAAEQGYLDRLGAAVGRLAEIRLPDSAKEDPGLLTQKEAVRDRAIKELRRRAEAFVRLPRGEERSRKATTELYETYRAEGRYKEWTARIDTIPFTVKPAAWPDQPGVYCDLKIDTRDVRIPEEKARLKLEIDAVLTVSKVVFGEREKTIGWRAWLIGRRAARIHAVQMRLHEYIAQLQGIAGVGLMNMDPTQASFARGDLGRFKSEFVAREGGTVKNRYLWRLGGYCLSATLAMALGYAFARGAAAGTVAHEFRNFFLLAMGTAIGTWLSFSLRRVSLSFDDLAVLEEDRLDPSLRVLFMIGLTTVVGLLFWTSAVSFGMGGLQSAAALQQHGAGALLIGLLGGIAERALGTAVSRRATDFATSIGGASPAAAGGAAAEGSGQPVAR